MSVREWCENWHTNIKRSTHGSFYPYPPPVCKMTYLTLVSHVEICFGYARINHQYCLFSEGQFVLNEPPCMNYKVSLCIRVILVLTVNQYMSHATRKPVFGVSNQVRLKSACSATVTSWSLEFLDKAIICIILSRQQTTKALIRLRRLICAFVVRIWQKQVFSRCGSYV